MTTSSRPDVPARLAALLSKRLAHQYHLRQQALSDVAPEIYRLLSELPAGASLSDENVLPYYAQFMRDYSKPSFAIFLTDTDVVAKTCSALLRNGDVLESATIEPKQHAYSGNAIYLMWPSATIMFLPTDSWSGQEVMEAFKRLGRAA